MILISYIVFDLLMVRCCGNDSTLTGLLVEDCVKIFCLYAKFFETKDCESDPSLQGLLIEQCFKIDTLLFRLLMDRQSLLIGVCENNRSLLIELLL